MGLAKKRPARLYARAMMCHKQWYTKDFEWAQRIDALAQFMHKERRYFWYNAQLLYQKVLEIFGFSYSDFSSLLQLLHKQHRLSLFDQILVEMADLYRVYNQYEQCKIFSSRPLTKREIRDLMEELEKKVHKKLYYDARVDKNIIAGIRVQGESFFWEHSIAQQLRQLEAKTVKDINLWK